MVIDCNCISFVWFATAGMSNDPIFSVMLCNASVKSPRTVVTMPGWNSQMETNLRLWMMFFFYVPPTNAMNFKWQPSDIVAACCWQCPGNPIVVSILNFNSSVPSCLVGSHSIFNGTDQPFFLQFLKQRLLWMIVCFLASPFCLLSSCWLSLVQVFRGRKRCGRPFRRGQWGQAISSCTGWWSWFSCVSNGCFNTDMIHHVDHCRSWGGLAEPIINQ